MRSGIKSNHFNMVGVINDKSGDKLFSLIVYNMWPLVNIHNEKRQSNQIKVHPCPGYYADLITIAMCFGCPPSNAQIFLDRNKWYLCPVTETFIYSTPNPIVRWWCCILYGGPGCIYLFFSNAAMECGDGKKIITNTWQLISLIITASTWSAHTFDRYVMVTSSFR